MNKPKKKPKKKLRPIKKLKSDLWDLVSLYIRKKYADKSGFCECYTCGVKKPWKELHAGHGISGRGNAVLFELSIIRPQCHQCNIFKHGNYQVFVPKLIREIGQEIYEAIEMRSHKEVKLSRNWYMDAIELLRKEVVNDR